MSRKTQMSMWKDGHRRSPRISALDAWKAHNEKSGGVNVSQNSIQVMPMEHNGLGPPSRTRARKKRKLRPVQDVAVSSVTTPANQRSKSPVDEDHPINSDQLSVFQAKDSIKHEDEWLPEKHILELILDTLQRRDTHEIFAEPVDPEEVEDYYEIIKEPMDFGTMRAKLHEGMYKNLEQFEHDVFLISSNAMHFNSSSTIYFRQARALQELSKKVFHVLKTDPRNFELEFSATRRRLGRRPPGDARGSNFSPPKTMTNVRSRNMAYDGSSKGIHSLSGPSSLRRSFRVNPGCSDTAFHFETGDPEILSGSGDGKSNLSETEQRCTYRPWTSFLDDNESIISTIYSYPRALLHVFDGPPWPIVWINLCDEVNQCDEGYTESLMMFVKDLGPVAQMVAKKKLWGWWPNEPNCPTSSSNNWFQAPKCENPAADILDPENTIRSENSPYHNRDPATHVLKSSSGWMDLTVAGKEVRADTNVTMASSGAREEVAFNSGSKSIHYNGWGKEHSNDRANFPAVLGGNTIHQKQSTEIQLASYSSTHAGDLNPSFDEMMITGNKSKPMHGGKLDYQVQQPLVLSSEPSQSNMFEKFTLRTVNASAPPSWPLQTKETPASSHAIGSLHELGFLQYLSNEDQATAAPPPKFTSSAQAGLLPGLNQPKPLVSQFIFDLPFLRSQLSQMNSPGQTGIMQRNSTGEGSFSEKRSHERASIMTMSGRRAEPSPQPPHGSQQRILLDSKPTDLALQL